MNHVPPQDLEHVWALVERGLTQIQRRVGKTNWNAEQVRNLILGGKAGLFICPDGFVILEPDHEPLSFKPFLNVWLAWFRPGSLKAMRKDFVPWVREKALQMVGNEDVRFSSPRQGWIGADEFEVHMITWRLKTK